MITRRQKAVTKIRTPSRLLKKQMRTALLFSTRRVADARAGRRDGPRASSAIGPEAPLACTARAETDPGSSYGLGREVADANQVVRREGQRKHPIHAAGASISRLAHEPHRLEPAEALL